MWNIEEGAGYVGGYELAGVGYGWLAGAGERYYYEPPIYTNGGGIGRDYPDIPTPNNPSPPEPQAPQQPQTPQPTQQPQAPQQQPTQQQQQQPSVIDMFNRLRSMFSPSYTPSAPVVLLQPPQPPATSYNYAPVLLVAIVAASIVLLYYIYKK